MIDYEWTRVDHKKYEELIEDAREVLPGATEDQVEDRAMWLWMRWKGSTDLYYFASEIMGLKRAKGRNGRHRLDPKIHKRMAADMEKEDDTMQLYFRGGMKSTFIKLWCIQKLIQNPMNRIGLWSITAALVRTELRHIKQLCQTPILHELWPEIFPASQKAWEKDTQDEFTMYRDRNLGDPPQDPQITVWGITGNVTGHHYDYQVYDDVINEQNITTADQMDKVRQWYELVQAIKEPTGIEKFIGTRYHQHDLYGEIIDKGLFLKENISVVPVMMGGKSNYSFLSKKDIEKIKRNMGDNFWPQYMLEPVPASRRIFIGPYPQYEMSKMPMEVDYYITMDPAATANRSSDHTAIAVAAIPKTGKGILYFVEVEQYKLQPDQVAEKLVDKIAQYRPRKVGIELGLQRALQYIIDIKLAAKEREIKDYIKPTFIEINTRLPGIQNKADKFRRTIGAFIRDNRCAFLPSMGLLFRQMDMYNPNSDNNDDDMIDACAMMLQTIERFSAAHWMNVKEVIPTGGIAWEQLDKMRKNKQAKKEGDWGWRFAS